MSHPWSPSLSFAFVLICGALLVPQIAEAGTIGLQLFLHRSPDVPIERLDRPLRDTDRPQKDQQGGRLTQADAIKAAKAELKEEVGKSFRDYRVRSTLFDPEKKEWSITFDPPPASSAPGCITVFVDDDTRETMLVRCR